MTGSCGNRTAWELCEVSILSRCTASDDMIDAIRQRDYILRIKILAKRG
jgi:hypothetical protein